MPDLKPKKIEIYAFNVGFGDCTLVKFIYPGQNRDRHILVDFGSKVGPEGKPSNFMTKVAKQIHDICNGKLDVIVGTHRHQDHISGFRTRKNGKGPGDYIAKCDPDLILQPWTEHPDIERDATGKYNSSNNLAFVQSHNSMDTFARSLTKFANSSNHMRGFKPREKRTIAFIGENAVSNLNAIKNLHKMSEGQTAQGLSKAQYLCFGDTLDLSEILPGVDVDVLGPPTTDQEEAAGHGHVSHSSENWLLGSRRLKSAMASSDQTQAPFDDAGELPIWARWGAKRLSKYKRQDLLDIVTRLDDHLNNTSLILLFTVGDKSLLFPGDAEVQNWNYALTHSGVKEKIKSVDLYKVGHHGSRNATPKESLWPLFENRCSHDSSSRMISLLSTKQDVYGTKHKVPKSSLVDALKAETNYISTEDHKLSKTTSEYYSKIEITVIH